MMRSSTLDMLLDSIEDLQAIDFGYLETAQDDEQEAALTFLETIVDELEELDIGFLAGDLAIQFFLTDPERARQYLYGPTDISDGRGFIDQLQSLAAEIEAEEVEDQR